MPPADAIVRPARPEDADPATEVWIASWLDAYPNPELGVDRDYLEARLARRQSAEGRARLRCRLTEGHTAQRSFFVAEAAGEIVGIAAPYRDETGTAHVGALYVDRAWWGAGVGAALLDAVIAWSGDGRLVLDVATYNARAIAFYRKHGFREVPGSEKAPTPEERIPTVRMERPRDAEGAG